MSEDDTPLVSVLSLVLTIKLIIKNDDSKS